MLSFVHSKFCHADLSWSVGLCGCTWSLVGFMDHTPSEGSMRVFGGGEFPAGAVQISIFSMEKTSSGLL